MKAQVHLHPPLPDESFRLLAEVGKKYRLAIMGRPNVFAVQSPGLSETELQHTFEVVWHTAGEFCRRSQAVGHGFSLLDVPQLTFVGVGKTAAGPTKAQLDYAHHLLKQVGAEEPDLESMSGIEVSKLIDGLKAKRGKPVFYGNGQFSHWEKQAADPIAVRVAARYLQAAYFSVGDEVLYGKYKNKRGKVVSFGKDKWGNPTIEIEPVPKGRKQNKVFGLYKVWRADVKEKALAEQVKMSYDYTDDDDGGDHDFDD